jgi:hypothetical protein
MSGSIVIRCDKGFPIDYEFESKAEHPFHFHRVFGSQPTRCPDIKRRIVHNICCELYCCNCDHLNLEPLED